MTTADHIESLEQDATLLEELHFDRRADALEDLDGPGAEALRARLEQIDQRLFVRLRAGIREGTYREKTFRNLADTYVRPREAATGYDNLDLFVNGLLSFLPLPEQTKALAPDMVYFQKTPARIVFELVARTSLAQGDVFVDLGSGLGQVALLVHLLTRAPARGIEYEPAFCAYARDIAERLRLPGVSFDNADARDADLGQGTVFFMFTPFTGNLLAEVLQRLQTESAQKKIRVITYGPCTAMVARASWLTPEYPVPADAYAPGFFKSV